MCARACVCVRAFVVCGCGCNVRGCEPVSASRGDKKVTWVLLNWNKVKGGPLANPNIRDNEGCTALHRAAFVQNEDIMKMLIAAGGIPHHRTRHAHTIECC